MCHRVDRRRCPATELAEQDVSCLLIAYLAKRSALAPDKRCVASNSLDAHVKPLRRRFEIEQRAFDGRAAAVEGQDAHETVVTRRPELGRSYPRIARASRC